MQQIIQNTEEFVKSKHFKDATGHDWYHVDRVRKLALKIHRSEQRGNPFMIEMAALLHDVADEKLNISEQAGETVLINYLKSLDLSDHEVNQLKSIIDGISFKGGHNDTKLTIEAQMVQDADRLDAIGAIGIARAFAYGGKKGQAIYDPNIPWRSSMTLEQYRHQESTSINHFYEKLLKLSSGLHTETGKKLAVRRQKFMESFLDEFYQDWNVDNDIT